MFQKADVLSALQEDTYILVMAQFIVVKESIYSLVKLFIICDLYCRILFLVYMSEIASKLFNSLQVFNYTIKMLYKHIVISVQLMTFTLSIEISHLTVSCYSHYLEKQI